MEKFQELSNQIFHLAKIIAEKDFPIFDIKLKVDEFEKEKMLFLVLREDLFNLGIILMDILRVSSTQDFEVGESFIGESSGTQGTITEVLQIILYMILNLLL